MTAALQSLGIGAGCGLILFALIEAWARRWGKQFEEPADPPIELPPERIEYLRWKGLVK